MRDIINKAADWLKKRTYETGAEGVVFGLSGGVDSAVVAGISKIAFPETSLGIIMPIESLEEDEKHARLLADKLGLEIKRVDLTPTFKVYKDTIGGEDKFALSNIKPRLRMTTLYYYAQSLNRLVLGCSNASEFMTGYFTKYGDSGADLIPLAEFVKSEIYEMASELGVPDEIIKKAPSAGLWEGQTDEGEMGFTYGDIEKYLNGEKLPKDIFEKIERKHMSSNHKRLFPPVFHSN